MPIRIIDRHLERTIANAIYPNQNPRLSAKSQTKTQFKKVQKPLRIQGKEPPAGGGGSAVLRHLQKVLRAASIPHEFIEGDTSMAYYMDQSFDIRAFSQSVGGEVRPWTLNVLFCSPLAYGFPDPTGKICELIREYDAGTITAEEVTRSFFQQIDEDNLIFPMAHNGVTLFISPSIDRDSLSPAMSVPRFDEIRLTP
ncbi:MAG: hypothetical protein EOO18_08250 [Chryseobacterium sp.]|nr:MAG: hypothetical protein EOO18_08250 [Chryseobacterium sp.]